MGFLEEESSSSKKRKEQAEKEAAEKAAAEKAAAEGEATDGKGRKKKKKISPKVRVFEDKSAPKISKDDSDFKRSDGKKSGKKSTPDKDKSSESDKDLGKTKQITKQGIKIKENAPSKKEEYFTFYKYYFERLGAEHPRWTKNQITTIIKLLWRKRTKSSRRIISRGKKGLTGRQLYRRSKEPEGFNKEQIKFMWKSLPHESKVYWHIKAQGKPDRKKNLAKRILNKGASQREAVTEESKTSNHSWINNPMI